MHGAETEPLQTLLSRLIFQGQHASNFVPAVQLANLHTPQSVGQQESPLGLMFRMPSNAPQTSSVSFRNRHVHEWRNALMKNDGIAAKTGVRAYRRGQVAACTVAGSNINTEGTERFSAPRDVPYCPVF